MIEATETTAKKPVPEVHGCATCAGRMAELNKLQAHYKAQGKPMQELAIKSALQAVRRVAA